MLSASSAALSPASAASNVPFLPSTDCMPFARSWALAKRSEKNARMTTQTKITYGRMNPRRLVARIRVTLHGCGIGGRSVSGRAAQADGHIVSRDVHPGLDVIDVFRDRLRVRRSDRRTHRGDDVGIEDDGIDSGLDRRRCERVPEHLVGVARVWVEPIDLE